MKIKNFIVFFILIISQVACTQYTIKNNYSLEKVNDSEVPVCVNRPQRVIEKEAPFIALDQCGNDIPVPGKYEETERFCDILDKKVVSYSYCLAELPKPVHLVEKKDSDMTICFDRNNKVKLPIQYCQKDVNVIQLQQANTTIWGL